MIDVETCVFDRVARALGDAFPGIYVSGQYVASPPCFPAVSVVEGDNYTDRETWDGDEFSASLRYDVDVYSDLPSGAKEQCRAVAAVLDAQMLSMNMLRTFMAPVDNAADPSIYRISSRYVVRADRNGRMYTR